jgi:hypothetical protein
MHFWEDTKKYEERKRDWWVESYGNWGWERRFVVVNLKLLVRQLQLVSTAMFEFDGLENISQFLARSDMDMFPASLTLGFLLAGFNLAVC